jgi:AcrR family transcriptional regulator
MSTAEKPVPTGRAAALPPEERRSTIVAAALPLIIEHGDAVTTRQIADAAGIAEGTIFRVFPDKDSVIRAAVEAVLDREPLEQALEAIDLDQPFEALLEAAIALVQERVVTIWRVVSSVGPRFHEHTKRGLVVSPWVERLLASHPDLTLTPAEAARVLHSLTLAVTHPNLAETAMPPSAIVRLFLDGVRGGHSC